MAANFNSLCNAACIIVFGGSGGGAPVNVTAPEVTGTAAVDSTLSVSNGTWDVTPDSFAYRWVKTMDGVTFTTISGATSNTFTVTNSEFSYMVACYVTAIKNGHSSAEALSDCTAEVQPSRANLEFEVIADNAGVENDVPATLPDSAGAYSASQSTEAFRAPLKTISPGKLAIELDGSTQFYTHNYPGSAVKTIYVVAKAASSSQAAYAPLYEDAYCRIYAGFLGTNWGVYDGSNLIAGPLPTTTAIFTVSWDGSSLKLYLNGELLSTTTTDCVGNSGSIGGEGAYGRFFAGKIAQIKSFSIAHDFTELSAHVQYLAAKYAIALLPTPTNLIAGASGGMVRLSWSDVGATTYTYWRNGVQITPGITDTFVDLTFAEWSAGVHTISALDAYGETPQSAGLDPTVDAGIPVNVTAPVAVTYGDGASVDPANGGSLGEWLNLNNIVGNYIHWAPAGSDEFGSIADATGGNTMTFTVPSGYSGDAEARVNFTNSIGSAPVPTKSNSVPYSAA